MVGGLRNKVIMEAGKTQKPTVRYEIYQEGELFWWRLLVGEYLITQSPYGFTDDESCQRHIDLVRTHAKSDAIRV